MNKGPLVEVEQAAVHFMQNYTPEVPLEVQLEGHFLLQKLKLLNMKSLALPHLHLHTSSIAEKTIETSLDSEGLRMSLYYMPKCTLMGLHNHPQMMVVSYIIQGQIQSTIYTPQNEQNIYFKQQVLLKSGSLTYIDGLRTSERNLHQLKAIQNTLFLDILFPDYDDQERDCLCFRENKELQGGLFELKQVPCTLALKPL